MVVAMMRATTQNVIIGRATLLFFSSLLLLNSSSENIFLVLVAAIDSLLTRSASLCGLLCRVKKRNIPNFKLFNVHLFAPIFITLVGRVVRLLFLKLVGLTSRAYLVVQKHSRLQLN